MRWHWTILTGVLWIITGPVGAQNIQPENNSIACSDGIDNDGDGLIDCQDLECANLPNKGCITCFQDGLSFADYVISFESTCSSNLNINPNAAIGLSDLSGIGTDVSLGEGGSITLGFNNNLIVNSGDSNPDIWVFEVGSLVEASRIELRPFDQNTMDILNSEGIPDSDLDGYFDFGVIAGSTSSLDIDSLVTGYSYAELKFDAIQIIDVPTECRGITPGADIDAVCALSSLVVDCTGTANGSFVIDDCGQCLEPSDSNFNQSCTEENRVYIPNAFTPNNDGLNDNFQLYKKQTTDAKVNTYLIFNRWGELIFESKNFEFGSTLNWWNGEHNGQKVPTGVYVYMIEIKFQGDEVKKYRGGVTVIM